MSERREATEWSVVAFKDRSSLLVNYSMNGGPVVYHTGESGIYYRIAADLKVGMPVQIDEMYVRRQLERAYNNLPKEEPACPCCGEQR
jgi:hypothetical protein